MKYPHFPKVAAIIIHWNQDTLTRETISSLLQTGYQNLRIILVDNGSTEGSCKKITEDFPEVLLVRTGENLGYAGGANLGFTTGFDSDAEYLLLLNNDVMFDKRFIEELLAVMEGDGGTNIGLCVPKIYYFDEPQKIWYAGGYTDPKTGLCYHYGSGHNDGPEYSEQRDCTFANGCAMFMRREAFNKTGLFDTGYFHTGEDFDYSLRLLSNGYRIVFVPKAQLWHKIRSSTGGKSLASYRYLYYEHRNRLLIMQKYFMRNFGLKSYMTLASFFIRSILIEYRAGNSGGVRGIVQGIYDGLRGRSGERSLR